MNKLIIEKDSLNVLLNNKKKNVNDILKDLWDGNLIDVKMRLTTFYDYYYKKRSEGKCHRVALSHVCKKLIRVIYILETKHIQFDPSLIK